MAAATVGNAWRYAAQFTRFDYRQWFVALGGSIGVPALALRDRAASPIVDRAGANILTRT